ncbi:MAG TPA: glucuronate isomerase [Pirellulales bacterium]|jgi:glucuronate isomerase|nr:glucuronate isomerase [Pirellulales bacterium]
MSDHLRRRLFSELDRVLLVDPHTHIDPRAPAAKNLADILGYHYYTELAHSAGMPKARIEEPGLEPREKVRRLVSWLRECDNTIQLSWLAGMSSALFGLEIETIGPENCDEVFDRAAEAMARPDWAGEIMQRSRLEAVFLTNDFDDPLDDFDTVTYVPCLRTDELLFGLSSATVCDRLQQATGTAVHDPQSLVSAIGKLFEHFVGHGARACAVSLPASFTPARVSPEAAITAFGNVWRQGAQADADARRTLSYFVFWTLAEHCAEFQLPFDLMIGVERGVYIDGVHQGRDLYDSRVSLIQYRELLNAFLQVTFPISVLASVTNQELVSYSWIFPNVVTCGHWWYSNTPAYIEHDLAARLEAVPRTKQIGYYSDMYKLEFAWPKFAMYKRVLAKVLAERMVIDRRWSEERAIALGRDVLRENVDRIFYRRQI